MNLHLHFFPLFGVIDGNEVVVFAFILILVAIRTASRAQRDRYWADIARTAIEKGQPVPPVPPHYYRSWKYGPYGWTRGLVWIAIGVSFFLIPRTDLREWAPLPICIGVAILIIGLIVGFTSRGSDNRPPLS
ncbi:MAG TPA: DUF6249 domain-containing protein [Opitutaceae bacterium]|jgi:hypothetical protein